MLQNTSMKDYNFTNAILSTLSEAVIATNEEHKIAFINPAAKKLLGIVNEPLNDKTIMDIVYGGFTQGGFLASSMCNLKEPISATDKFVLSSGHYFNVAFNLSPIVENGDIKGEVLSFRDIDQQLYDAHLLRLQEEALNTAANMIMIVDINGTIEYVNNSFCEATGYTKEELLNTTAKLFHSSKKDRIFYEQLWSAIRKGESWEGEIEGERKDGSLYPEEMTITPIKHDGYLSHFIIIKKDITERKKAQDELKEALANAQQASKLKSEFLSTMSHEIRTPMNGIIGMTDLILRTKLNDEQQEFAQIIKNSSQTLLTIINDILDFSKIEAGKMDIELASFDVAQIVESVLELATAGAKGKKLSLMSFIDPQIKQRLIGDPTRIKQVLMNLVSNAIKFTEKGEVVARVILNAETTHSYMLRFEVIDSGIGISKDAQKKLFQSFIQADGSTTRKYGGTGLGLAISKRLIELMGGTIGVQSVESQGSVFWFELSFDFANETRESKPICADVLTNKKILIVDDSASARDILRIYALHWGMIPICAPGADEAIKLLSSDIDVAIIDLAMPNIDGIELAKMIKKEQDGIRMLLFTAFDQRGVYESAIDAGFDYYLTKPIKQDQLQSMLCSLCSGEVIVKTNYAATNKPKPTLDLQDFSENKSAGLILLVEDNTVNQKLASILLTRMGYDFQIANNGQEALERLSFDSFDAILMDCQMPVLDGFEATQQIRQSSASYKDVPIIAMTANAIQGDKERCIASGMNDYVSKPIDVAELEQKLGFWTQKEQSKQNEPIQKPQNNDSIDSYKELIDLARIKEIFGDDMIKDILTMTKNSTHSTLELLSHAIDEDNFELAYKAGHDLKGECGNIGVIGLEKTAALIEESAKQKDKAGLNALIITARAQWQDLQNYTDGL